MKKKARKVTCTKTAPVKTNKNGVRRTTLGASLCIGSILYLFVLSDVSIKCDLFGLFLLTINAAAFILGVRIITQSFDKFRKVMNRIWQEISGLTIAVISFMEIYFALKVPFARLSRPKQILTFVAVLFFCWYLIRLSRLVVSLVKKISEEIVKAVKKKNMKASTELIDTVLKNCISIAGTISLFFNIVKPIVCKILGM